MTPSKRSSPGAVGQRLRILALDDLGIGGEDLVHARRRRGRARDLRDHERRHPQREDELQDVEVERDQRGDGQVAVDHLAATDPEDADETERRQHLEQRVEQRAQARQRHAAVVDAVGGVREVLVLQLLGAEALHDPDAREALLDDVRDTGEPLLEAHRDRMQQRREPDRGDEQQREASRARPTASFAFEHEQHDRDADDHHEVRAGDRDEHEQHLHLLGVGADPRHQLTDLGAVVVAEVQPLQVVEQPAAQLGFGPQRDRERGGAPEVA